MSGNIYYSKNPSAFMKLAARLATQTFTQAQAEKDIPDGSLIDMRDFEYVLATVSVAAAGVGTGGGSVKFYHNTTNAGPGTVISSKTLALVDADDGKAFDVEIRTEGLGRYLNIGAVAASGTGDLILSSVVVHLVGPKHKTADASLTAVAVTTALT